jgi:rfaE bifunctional protein kinase chain/domain
MKKVVVIGDIMVDHYIYGTCDRVSPEAPVPVVKVTHEEYVPGGAANVAQQLSIYKQHNVLAGFATGLLWSESPYQKRCIVECGHTIHKTRVVANRYQLIRFDRYDRYDMDKSQRSLFRHKLNGVLNTPDLGVVIIADYNKGTISKTLAKRVIDHCNMFSVPILVDTKRSDISCFKNATAITPNKKEWELIKKNTKKPNILVDYILVTSGADGVTLIDNTIGTTETFPSKVSYVFDVVGAGDVLIATLAKALIMEFDIKTATHIANVAAGISVTKPGTSSVENWEISYFL